ncbi:MAG TPA: hypothetical protein VKB46_05365 [Pyrinomonadaceae bacterium]|nr:hypothetical protein [Pyrinomonadaceae bacterium]
MKRVLIVVVLVLIAGIAGIVRSHSRGGSYMPGLASQNASGETRDEIRKTYELAPGAQVEIGGINGAVKIETADTRTAEVYIERIGASSDSLNRRKINIDANANSLKIYGTKGDVGFFARLFGSNPSERVTLKLPRQISLKAKGVNGAVTVGEIEGAVEVHGINGRVQVAGASGVEIKGINGNIQVGLKKLDSDEVSFSGVNGNIELQLSDGLNASLETHGMNGRVVSELSEVKVEEVGRHGEYTARIGSGGNAISAKGINGNIRLSRPTTAVPVTAAATSVN